MILQPGTKIGLYEVTDQIGSGSAGEIYKASDGQSRHVAIRVLPEGNEEMKQALRQEAQTVTALNHANICAMVDFVQENGVDYLVTEHLDGETLESRLKRGPLEMDETIQVAIAMADALDKAHRQGVVHRDLKPSNVMMTPGGVKLLDFGLSRLKASAPNVTPVLGLSSLPTRAASATAPATGGAAVQYMAPEQLEGKEADARTDIFAFGAVLYEMATGKKAFEGKTPALLVSAITAVEPQSLLKMQPMAPPALDHVIRRCLAKDPKQRLQTAWDLMGQLQWIAEGGSVVGIPPMVAAHRQKKERLVWFAALAALLLTIALAAPALRYIQGPPAANEVRFLEAAMGSTLGSLPIIGPFTVSPDGRWIALWGLDLTAPTGSTLFVRPIGSVAVQRLTTTDAPDPNTAHMFWSPDSKSIAYFHGGKLKRIDVAGGPPQNIVDAIGPFGGGAWSREGIIVYSAAGKMYRVLAAGGESTEVSAPGQAQKETAYRFPHFLPDGRHYLYLSASSDTANNAIYVGDLETKERTRLVTADSKALYAAPGYLLFQRGGTLFVQAFDADDLTLSGEAVRIADPISATAQNGGEFDVSQNGVLTYRITAPGARGTGPVATVADRPLRWINRSGTSVGQAGVPGPYLGVDVTADGKRVAVHRHEGEGGDIWIWDSERGTMDRFTFDATQDNSSPVFSPDGKQVAFASRRNEKWGIYMKATDGAAKEELLVEADGPASPMSWSPDGKLVVYRVFGGSTDFWAVPVTGDKKAIPILQDMAFEQNAQISPDGKWIAYSSNETANRYQIYIRPFPEGAGKWQVSTDAGFSPRWRRDGKELYFLSAGGGPAANLMAAEIRVTGSSVQSGSPRILFAAGYGNTAHGALPVFSYNAYAVADDGRFLIPQGLGLATAGNDRASALAEFSERGGLSAFITRGGGAPVATPITVVLNWTTALKR